MYLILILQQILSSITHIVAKDVTTNIIPSSILFYRSLIAAIFFFLIVKIRNNKIKVEKKDYLTFIILSILNIPINQFLFLISIKYTTAPNVALAYALSPIFVYIIAHFYLKEKSSYLKITGIAIAIIGAFFLISEKGFSFRSTAFLGDILALSASLAWALYTVLGKNVINKYGAIYSAAITMQLGFVLYLVIYLFLPEKSNPLSFTTFNWFDILYLGIFSSGVSYILWYYALKKIQASKVSVFNNLQPIFTTILAIIFLNQSLTLTFVSGGLMILLGVVLTQTGK